ncbi:hypothetical protein ABZ297_17340 [Nonomuraea sp. NPDC005983]|uniref:hypothetical protein n=1 Tax=Nonomuraea sp. NPDC005983 TaxID=3155595 RepID=UPI0033A1CEAB
MTEHIAPPPSAEPTEAKADRGSVLELFEKIGSVALPLAVALYAVLYIGLQNVYYVFGITPEQAGLDQATIFARLISTLVTVLLGLIPVVGAIVGLGWLVNLVLGGRAARAVDRLREKPWLAAVIGVLASSLAYWGYLKVVQGVSAGAAVFTALGIAVFGLLVPYRLLRRRPSGRAGMKVLTGALVGLGLGFLLAGQMVQGALDIYENGNGNYVLDLVGVKNQWATVQDGDGKPLDKEREGDRMMLLGEEEGTYVFYDCGMAETIRRPVEATTLNAIELDPDFTEGGTQKPVKCGYALPEADQPHEDEAEQP